MKVVGVIVLLALTWAPRPPTRGLQVFLERLNLGIYIENFEREELDLSMVRRMTEEQLQRIGILRMGQRLNILQAAAELTDEDLQPVEEDREIPQEEEAPEQEV